MATAPSVPPAAGVSDTQITLGMTTDLNAVGQTPYGAVTAAVQAYLAKVNTEDSGVCGRQVILLAEDDQYNANAALQKAHKLVEQDRVLAMIGALGTANHIPVAPYLNDPNGDGDKSDGIPDLFLSTGWSGWGDVARFPWTIGYIPDYVTDARVLTTYINESSGGKKVAVLYENDEFGRDYLGGLKQALARPESLVSEQVYEPNATDLAPQVTAIRDAGAEVVLLASTPAFTALAMKAAQAANFHPQFVMSYVNAPSTLASVLGGGPEPNQLLEGFKQLNGTISTEYLLSTVEDAESPPLREHRRIMATYRGPATSALSVYAQSLAEVLVETLRRACPDLSRKAVLEAAQSLRGFHSSLMLAGIDVNLSPADHYSIQALRRIRIEADGTLTGIGEPISQESN